MNADDLRTNLERRAASTGSTPELLPAVRQAMAHEPQRPSTSRLPAFAGLAAAVAVLLAVVVAMPRITPQGAPPASTAAGSATLSPTASPTSVATPHLASPLPSQTGPAWWELAADERPTAESTELDVTVYERACAGGQSPEGRLIGPQIEYDTGAISITFSVRSLPGEGDCQLAHGVRVSVHLSEPVGDRRLVDGDDLAGDVVIVRDADFLALATHRVDEYASERFEAMFGAGGCTVTSTTDRYVPTDAELRAAVEALAGLDGQAPGGGYVSEDWLSAARAFKAVEAYAGRPKPWYILTSHEGSPALRSISPTTVAGRTVWFPSDYARLPNRECEQPRSTTSPRPEARAIECSTHSRRSRLC